VGDNNSATEAPRSEARRLLLAGLGAAPLIASAARASPLATEFDLRPGLIHLNTASLGPTPRSILDRTVQAWRELETSPVYMGYGRMPDTVVSAADRVRGKAAALLGCDAEEVLVTTGTTSGMTILAQAIALNRGDRVLMTDQEHEGGSVGWQHLERRRGIAIDRIAIAPEEHDMAAILRRFAAAIRPETRVISVSHVISATGLRMPVAEIAALARRGGALCIVDGAQAVGCIDVDVKALGCHAYATSGHKWLMGPKGTGLLYIIRDAGAAIEPVQWELARQYGSDSAGVGPMPLAIGLGEAIDMFRARDPKAVERQIQKLRDYAWRGLARIPGARMAGPPPGERSSGLAACILPAAVESRSLRDRLLARHGIIVKMAEKRWFNGIRLSPHIFNTTGEIDRALAAIRLEIDALSALQ
jgi:selenocysteine lyase/cysteine desulfurase